MLVELGRFTEAMNEFTNALQLDPAYPWAHFHMAKALLKQGRDAEAIEQFRAALRLDPENFQILAYIAHVLAAEENPEVRDGKTALVLAIKANNLTGGNQPYRPRRARHGLRRHRRFHQRRRRDAKRL